jgi:hypothetical protein
MKYVKIEAKPFKLDPKDPLRLAEASLKLLQNRIDYVEVKGKKKKLIQTAIKNLDKAIVDMIKAGYQPK